MGDFLGGIKLLFSLTKTTKNWSIFPLVNNCAAFLPFQKKRKKFTRSEVRTHAGMPPLELKSNALTTRPSWWLPLSQNDYSILNFRVRKVAKVKGHFLSGKIRLCAGTANQVITDAPWPISDQRKCDQSAWCTSISRHLLPISLSLWTHGRQPSRTIRTWLPWHQIRKS